ncbi:MAG: OstA-like protein, partial [Chitinophagaceae bacterium]
MKQLFASALVVLLTFCGTDAIFAQTGIPATSPPADTTRTIEIIHADRMSGKKIDSTNELIMLVGHVEVKDGKTLFTADSIVNNKKLRIIEAFGNVHINDNDSIHTRSSYLIYYLDKK